MKWRRAREPLITYTALLQGRLDLRKFRPPRGYDEMRGKIDCSQFAATAEEILRKQRRVRQHCDHASGLATLLERNRLAHRGGQSVFDADEARRRRRRERSHTDAQDHVRQYVRVNQGLRQRIFDHEYRGMRQQGAVEGIALAVRARIDG